MKAAAIPAGAVRALCVVALCALLQACFGNARWDHTPRDVHIVRVCNTLYTIAFRYGRDYRDLARWNRLGDGSLIYPGQAIRLTPPARGATPPRQSAPVAAPPRPAPPPAWSWPTPGAVAAGFDEAPGNGAGILIRGDRGQAIRAAADGRVVYSGGGLIGYEQLIIIKHNDTYLSAYGHNASLLVKEGEAVKKGQRIATMGEGPGRLPGLHFEIRRNGKPVDPRQYLPAR